MAIITSTFEGASQLYAHWFADWLHIHFLIRTVLILLVVWLFIYVVGQLFRYVFAPFTAMFFFHVFFRAYNFVFVESVQEWIYIRYYSQDKPNFNALYLRLSDRMKRNRDILNNANYSSLVGGKLRRASIQSMVMCATAATLWVTAFGLHHEYTTPAMIQIDNTQNTASSQNNNNVDDQQQSQNENDNDPPPTGSDSDSEVEYPNDDNETADIAVQPVPTPRPGPPQPPTHEIYAYGLLNPAMLPPNTILTLSYHGQDGARLREGPGIAGYNIVEIIWGNIHLLYLNQFKYSTNLIIFLFLNV